MSRYAINLFFALALVTACRAEPAAVQLAIKGNAAAAEVAATRATRERGLMLRKTLPENRGMLFVFAEPDRYSMWMENTYLPLSVAFIDRNGAILNVEEMQPLTRNIHTAAGKAQYALEMNAGWFAQRGIRAGDQVFGLKSVPRGQ